MREKMPTTKENINKLFESKMFDKIEFVPTGTTLMLTGLRLIAEYPKLPDGVTPDRRKPPTFFLEVDA